jgi:hypothetical protein
MGHGRQTDAATGRRAQELASFFSPAKGTVTTCASPDLKSGASDHSRFIQ